MRRLDPKCGRIEGSRFNVIPGEVTSLYQEGAGSTGERERTLLRLIIYALRSTYFTCSFTKYKLYWYKNQLNNIKASQHLVG